MLGLLVLFVTYLVGSIPCGLLLSKAAGYGDLRAQGSGNIGSTNAWRVGGKPVGIATLVCDALKGMVPVYLVQQYVGNDLALWAVLCAVVGHVFPLWLHFQGGRGVATAMAGLLVVTPLLSVVMILTWALMFWRARTSSIASLASVILAWALSFLYPAFKVFIVVSLISAIIVWRHRDNIERILEGRENPFDKIQ